MRISSKLLCRLVMVPVAALAAAALLVAWTPASRADEGRFTIMLLNIEFFPNARPKWGDVYGARLAPTIQFSSFEECYAATDRVNRRYRQKTKAFFSSLYEGRPYNHQIICYNEAAESKTWDVCDRAHLGFEYAKTCHALTYIKPHITKILREDRRRRIEKALGR